MKHVRKRYLVSRNVEFDINNVLDSVPIDHEKIEEIKRNKYKGYVPFLVTDTQILQAFIYNFKGKQISIPEPHPIVIYFHIAQLHLKEIFHSKAALFSEFEKRRPDVSAITNDSYRYFSAASTSAMFLFNSIEALINLLIPEEYTYKRTTSKNTEVYNKEQIQKNISFEEKIKNIIPEIKHRSFHQEYAHKFDSILRLKSLRDEIAHTKTHLESKPNWYKVLFTNLLDFDFIKTIKHCKDYVNFYEPNLIEECDCGANY